MICSFSKPLFIQGLFVFIQNIKCFMICIIISDLIRILELYPFDLCISIFYGYYEKIFLLSERSEKV